MLRNGKEKQDDLELKELKISLKKEMYNMKMHLDLKILNGHRRIDVREKRKKERSVYNIIHNTSAYRY